ncbi:IS66 family transposase zinc-finger binding domain-containing protein [Ureibacillus thermosphaericus]
MTEIGSTIVREEAKFIPAIVKRVRHIEHAYECRNCKKDLRGKVQGNHHL